MAEVFLVHVNGRCSYDWRNCRRSGCEESLRRAKPKQRAGRPGKKEETTKTHMYNALLQTGASDKKTLKQICASVLQLQHTTQVQCKSARHFYMLSQQVCAACLFNVSFLRVYFYITSEQHVWVTHLNNMSCNATLPVFSTCLVNMTLQHVFQRVFSNALRHAFQQVYTIYNRPLTTCKQHLFSTLLCNTSLQHV